MTIYSFTLMSLKNKFEFQINFAGKDILDAILNLRVRYPLDEITSIIKLR